MGISVGGLSGFDTDSLVSQLMEIERIPLTNVETRRDEVQAEKDAFDDFNKLLLDLKTKASALTQTTTWQAMRTASSSSSVAIASASSSASTGTYKFTVTSIGTQAYSMSQADIAANSIDPSETLDTLDGNGDFVTGLAASGTGSFKIIIRDSNDAIVKEDTIEYDTANDSLNDIISKINRSDADVTAFYDEDSSGVGKFIITSDDTGKNYVDIDTTNDTSGLLSTLNIYNPADNGAGAGYTDATTAGTFIDAGTDASVTLNDAISINPTGNTYTVNGTTITFLTAGDATISVTKDTDAIYNKIADFTSSYNAVQDYITEQTSYKDGATGGPLATNSLIKMVSYNLQNKISSTFGDLSNYTMLFDIGIETGAYGTDDENHLVIDTSKLKSAIDTNSYDVELLFGYGLDSTSTPSNSVAKTSGIAYSIDAYLEPLTKFKGLISDEQDSLDSIIENYNESIDRMTERLDNKETQLRNQFSQMEQSLSLLQSQGDYFSSQLSNLNSS